CICIFFMVFSILWGFSIAKFCLFLVVNDVVFLVKGEFMEKIYIGDVSFIPKIRSLELNGIEVKLRNKESEVLALLCECYPDPVSRDKIENSIWTDSYVTDNTLTQTISNLRNALNDKKHELIITIPKKGYCLGFEPKFLLCNDDNHSSLSEIKSVTNIENENAQVYLSGRFSFNYIVMLLVLFFISFLFLFEYFFNKYQVDIVNLNPHDLPVIINLDLKKDKVFLDKYRKKPSILLKKNSDGSYNICKRVKDEFLCTRE
ncbi:winged helix-turn-helix domain-containing protein, partial [Yersinia ruckeri]|uniref:winged helix-turn-helix domain-containing protein n=3 Tax=Yersinia ruckeri TaxID=29486 RepID=UPI001FE6367C